MHCATHIQCWQHFEIPALAVSLEFHTTLLGKLPLVSPWSQPQQSPSPALPGDRAAHTSLLYTASPCSSWYQPLCAIILWQLAPNQSPFSSQLPTCCSWPAALSSPCFFPPPSRLAVVSQNYPYFSLLGASHMLSSLVRCSFPHTHSSYEPGEVFVPAGTQKPAWSQYSSSNSNNNALNEWCKR